MASKTLITGAGGMLGADLVPAFKAAFGDDSVVALSRSELDIANASAVFGALREIKPEVVVNAAAYTNVDRAEVERDLAFAGNAQGPTYLAQACAEYGVRLVHYSTDQVFDGTLGRPATETDEPHPVNHYAETKLLGEKAVLTNSNSIVMRVQWLYGKQKDRFTPLKDKTEFFPFSDQYGCPTWSKHVAEVTVELVLRRVYGLFHMAYDDYASWADVFQYVKELKGYDVQLHPRTTVEANLPAKRPLFSVMSNKKLLQALQRSAGGSWKTALRQFLS